MSGQNIVRSLDRRRTTLEELVFWIAEFYSDAIRLPSGRVRTRQIALLAPCSPWSGRPWPGRGTGCSRYARGCGTSRRGAARHVSDRLGVGGHDVCRHVRGERVAGAEPDDEQQEPGGADSAGHGDARRLAGRRGDAARLQLRPLQPHRLSGDVSRQRQLDRPRLRGLRAGRASEHVHHVVPGRAGICALSGKRLITNQEWQRAAAGTPDSGVDDGSTLCNISATGNPSNTGSRSACVSKWGAFDMVGNVWEWVGDWGDRADGCVMWSSTFGSDVSCVGGPGSSSTNLPGALFRGGFWFNGTGAGVFTANGLSGPSLSEFLIGFRCAR